MANNVIIVTLIIVPSDGVWTHTLTTSLPFQMYNINSVKGVRSVKWLLQIKQQRKIASIGYKGSSEAQLCKSVLWASPYIYIAVSDYVSTEIHLYVGDSPHRVQSRVFLFSVKRQKVCTGQRRRSTKKVRRHGSNWTLGPTSKCQQGWCGCTA